MFLVKMEAKEKTPPSLQKPENLSVDFVSVMVRNKRPWAS